MKERVYIYRVDTKKIIFRGHSKSTLARNFQFLTPLPLVRFTCTSAPSPQLTFALVSYPPLKKSSAMFMTLISNKKSGGEKREKN